MIYYIFAMRCEAEPFIGRLDLKKNTSYRRMEVFENETCVALIAGSGFLKAAMAVTELLSTRDISERDFIVNVGICGYMGSRDVGLGTVYICNSIENDYDGRMYYPDMIYKSPFEERGVVTYSKAAVQQEGKDGRLADMEAAGIYEAAIRFVKTNQIAFIKIVSDYCDGKFPLKEEVKEYVDMNADMVIGWVGGVSGTLDVNQKVEFTEDEIAALNNVAEKLRYSVTRKNQLKKEMIYQKLMGQDIKEMLEERI